MGHRCRVAALLLAATTAWGALVDPPGAELTWTRGRVPTSPALVLAGALDGAGDRGLDPGDYGGGGWRGRLEALRTTTAPDEELARLDGALTRDALRFLGDLSGGRLATSPARDVAGRWRSPADVAARGELEGKARAALARLAVDGDLAAALLAVEPPFPAYRRTVAALERYRALAARGDGPPVPPPPRTLAAGAPFAGASALAARLRLLGDLPEEAPTARDRYDAALAGAVARFQARHGLDPTGRLDAATARALDVRLARRAAQLALTLERWRWLPRRFGAPPLVVNIPEFVLRGADPARPLAMKIVVGRAYHQRLQTPVFAAEVREVVFHPPWSVPLEIQREELVPEAAGDPGYLARHGYEVLDRGGRRVEPGPGLLDGLRSGALRLRQRPGPSSALGVVKLVAPNAYDVYLHGTPARELFARSRRDFSHGCVRVEHPGELAAWALRDEPGWTPDRVRAALAGATTIAVPLSRPIPLLVLYGTAVVTPEGEVRFFDDLYGWDAALERALAARAPAPLTPPPSPPSSRRGS